MLQHPSPGYLHTMAHQEGDDDDSCNTALRLAPAYPKVESSCDDVNTIEKKYKKSASSLSFSLLSSPELERRRNNESTTDGVNIQQTSSNSNSNSSGTKRENQSYGGEGDEEIQRDTEKERVCSRLQHVSDEDEESCSPRKKLRLSKEQTLVLEDCFKLHTTLNPKQKEDLAKQLNLRPRQVEVWFQNRRARTKLKQTEVECEMLKKHCETLKEENRRLQKELQELKAFKQTSIYMQMPAATLSMCPSCERIGNSINGPDGSAKPATPKIFSTGRPKSSIISLI